MRLDLSFVLAAALTGLHFSGAAVAAESSEFQENSRFAVSAMPCGSFQVKDRAAENIWDTPVLNPADRWKLIPEGHWLSFEKASPAARTPCLLDLKAQTFSCDRGFALEPGEGAWSPSGRWLAWKSPDSTTLHFSDSESAELTKEGTLPVPKWSITGDPLGLIWQQKWLSDDQLLVGTGSGEDACYGIFDFSLRQFYSLACLATPTATLEELSRAIGNPEAWLAEKGLLVDRGRWDLVDPLKFP
jgi:hypothetical protein